MTSRTPRCTTKDESLASIPSLFPSPFPSPSPFFPLSFTFTPLNARNRYSAHPFFFSSNTAPRSAENVGTHRASAHPRTAAACLFPLLSPLSFSPPSFFFQVEAKCQSATWLTKALLATPFSFLLFPSPLGDRAATLERQRRQPAIRLAHAASVSSFLLFSLHYRLCRAG